MKLAIMQPYFLPYIGYFQLIHAVDKFVVYDNIKYTKKGWINRNRYLVNGSDELFSIPLSKDSDHLDVVDRKISTDFNKNKLLNQIAAAYRNAPCFLQTISLFEEILFYDENNLFKFIFNSIVKICSTLEINTEILMSSSIDIDHGLKSKDKVIALCQKLGSTIYINPIGGQELYDKEEFWHSNINVQFVKSDDIVYKQFDSEFIPWLSILDMLMFNSQDEVKNILTRYQLI